MRYTTKSGSVYVCKGLKIQKIVSGAGQEGRLTTGDSWKTAQSISCDGIGHPLIIYWGSGTDEYSPEGIPPETNQRYTITTPVTEIDNA